MIIAQILHFGKKKMEVCMTVFEMIEAQQKGLEDTTVYMVGQQLKDICRSDPACAAIVAEDLQNKEMSIASCEKKIKAYADEIKAKKKVKAVGVSPEAAERIIRQFYGLPEGGATIPQPPTAAAPFAQGVFGQSAGNGVLDLDALLGL